MAPVGYPKSPKQIEFVDALRARLRITKDVFAKVCEDIAGVPYDAMDMNECSRLISQLEDWTELPAQYLRAMGQQDLPGFG